MNAERWARVRSLVENAMALPPEQRLDFLRNTGSDEELIVEAEHLLSFDRQASALFPIERWKECANRAAAVASLAGTMLGNYRLLEELGRGGMGAVYLAERADGAYQQKVALKILQENIFTPALVERFRQERQILARLKHPGIARLLDGGVMPDGRPYLVLEYIDGQPIDRYCDEHQLDVNARLHLFLRVAEVVQSAHQQFVLHLDLKPANILVTAEGEPRLLDFGIARILSESEAGSNSTEMTLRLLTPRYASPEQANGAPLGVGSDVFSLATMLYWLLTGTLPYPLEDVNPLEAARMIREVEPRVPSLAAPSATGSQLRGDIDTILLQALRKEPERRYATIAAFAEDVQRHLASQPVLAHADSFRYRAAKFLRRNRTAAIAASIAFAILSGSAIAVLHFAIVAQRERTNAERRLKDVRALAHSYIFDLDPQLAEVPGTVGVRSFILKSGLKYLEAMSKEDVKDDDLAREIGNGYLTIGEVQADPAMPSLNDRPGAWDSMTKGLAIQKRLFDKNPADLDQLYLVIRQLRSMDFLALADGDVVRSDQLAHQAWDAGKPILSAGPAASQYFNMNSIAWDLASNDCGNGDLWNFADPMASLPWLDRMHEIIARVRAVHPDGDTDIHVIHALEREAITRARVFQLLDRNAEARSWYKEALRLVEMSPKTVVEEQSRKVIRATYADFLVKQHDLGPANAMAPILLPEEYDEKGHDRSLSGDVADTLGLLARIDLESGRTASGRKKMQISVDGFNALYATDPNDATSTSEMAHALFDLAEIKVLDAPTRRRLYLRTIQVTQPYAETHPQVLSAALLIGQCEVGLAQLAHTAHDWKDQRLHAANSIAQLSRVLAAHPVQPEANRALTEAKALKAG